jgi:hypothetical protein
MSAPQAEGWTRRAFLGGLTLAGTASKACQSFLYLSAE